MHADGKSTLTSVSKWNSGKVNCVVYDKNAGTNLLNVDVNTGLGTKIIHPNGHVFIPMAH